MNAPATAITLGNLDGVHLGHRSLVARTCALAEESGLRSAALFFDPHPSEFFNPQAPVNRITTVARRRELLGQLGVHQVIVSTFDRAYANQSPVEFFERILVEQANARDVIVGPYFSFGKERAGGIDTLRELGEAKAIGVHVVEPVHDGEERVSSTLIRQALRAGDIEATTRLLGRLHDVDGRVVHGDHRARTLGFPTANLDCDPVLMPDDGVYAVLAQAPSWTEARWGVANLGVRPTFEAGRSVEVHLLDFRGDLYGMPLRLAFHRKLREERRFDGVSALRAQITQDCQAARRALVEVPPKMVQLFSA